MTSYTYSNDRRHDPELRDKVERVLKAQNAVILKAAKQLRQIRDEMQPLTEVRDSASLFDRSYDALTSAVWRLEHDSAFMNRHEPNDTYIGNMAAGEMGEYIQNVDFETRFKGIV